MSNELEKFAGRTVTDVTVESEDVVALRLDNGTEAKVVLYGDCCSRSYFTDPKQFMELVGKPILSVEERNGGSEATEDGKTDWAFLVFVTSGGHVTVDWRNESNGYYSGWVEVRFTEVGQ